MTRRSDERDGCDGDGNEHGSIQTSAGKYDRFWSCVWNVGKFIRLCKKGSILNGVVQLSGVPLLLPQHPTRLSSPTSTVLPLLQSEEQPNAPTDHREEGSSSSVFRSRQLSLVLWRSASSALHSQFDPKKTYTAHREEGSSSSVFRARQLSLVLRRSASSALHSQFDPKKTYTADEVPSPSSIVPLLQSAQSQTHLAINVDSNEEKEENIHKKIARILEEQDLNSLREFGGAENLALAFGSDLESGKTTVFQESSTFTYKKQVVAKDFPRFFIRSCNSYTIFLLIISGCFSLGFEKVEKSPQKGWWHDGAAIFLAVLLIVTADSVSSFGRARKQEKKMLKKSQIEVRAIRNGQSESVPIYGIVKGDLLCLEKDQTVPADGLLVSGGVEVDGHFDKHIDCNTNPFLFSGSMVVEGNGRMLVTSVGGNAVSFKEALLEARISKPNSCAEFFSLCMALIIALVLFLRFLRQKHDFSDGGSSQVKGEITVRGVLKIFERMLLKPRGIISILALFLATVVIGIQHGMPFVISISLAYWNQKKASDKVVPLTLSACGTMGLVTVICIDMSGGLIGEDEEEEEEASETSSEHAIDSMRTMKEAVTNFKMAGVDIKLVSGDDDGLSVLTDIACELGVYTADSTDEAIEGQDIRNLSEDVLKSRADRIKVMANFLPKDKLSMVQCLKEKGHVVAFYGGSTARDAMVLKVVDVGISNKNSTEMAKKSSDIIISSYKSFSSLIPFCKYGRWAYYNIQRFIQLQLTVIVSCLVITSVATMTLGESPITIIHFVWVNLITSILGGLMLVTEPESRVLRTLQAAGNRNEPVITKAMWVYILIQILYQASVLLIFLFEGQAILGINRRVKKAIIFSSFALCQIFNCGNAMDLEKKRSNGVKQKGGLLVSVGAAMAVQVLVAEIWARLNLLQWGLCFLIAALSWGLGLAMKALSPFMTNCLFISINSTHLRHSDCIPSRHHFCFIIFSSLFFLF